MSILEVNNVSIRYVTGDFKEIGLKEYTMRKLKKNYNVVEFWADKDITFSLEKGDMLGIIGANGAGKSTLLKVISGIMEPTKGSVKRQGTIAALLELGSGFDGDLTVRENAYLRGAMLGYTRKFMDEAYDQIIEFAELKDFEDRPFKQLSSGMKGRLAFSIASLVRPDILILDEVLAVGDGAFRKKSEEKMREIMGGGTTTILVSHSVAQVRAMCNKVLWLHKGEQIAFGENVEQICDRYQRFLDGAAGLPTETPVTAPSKPETDPDAVTASAPQAAPAAAANNGAVKEGQTVKPAAAAPAPIEKKTLSKAVANTIQTLLPKKDALTVAVEELVEKAGLIPNQRMGVLYHNNLGDWYCLCSSIKYAEETLGQKFVLLYCSDAQKEIADWFSYGDYSLELYRLDRESYSLIQRNKGKHPDLIHRWDDDHPACQFTHNYKSTFCGGNPENIRKPILPEFDQAHYIEKYGIKPGQTILIIPQAVAVAPFPDWFWNLCADIFRSMGYAVLFNVSEQDARYFNGTTVFPPISDMVGLANLCGHVFAVRTGLLDVISSTTAKMTIFSTKAYKELNKVFFIPNEDRRIQTIFYENNDLFYEKTAPISAISKMLRNEREPFIDLIHALIRQLPNTTAGKILDADLSASPYRAHLNRINRSASISPFWDVRYSFARSNNYLFLEIFEFDPTAYRIDVTWKLYGKPVCTLTDFKSGKIVYPPEKTGRYTADVTITDLGTCNQEYFTTEALMHTAPVPATLAELSQCRDLPAYVSALQAFAEDIVVLISSRDAHTPGYSTELARQLSQFKELGIHCDLINTFRHSFLCVMDGGQVITEQSSEDQYVSAEYAFGGHRAKLVSKGFHSTQSDRVPIEITVDGADVAVNHRGLNIVVWDKKNGKLADSVCFDTFAENVVYRPYVAPVPAAVSELCRCRDLPAYVTALRDLSDDILVLISSRDAHTQYRPTERCARQLSYFKWLGLSYDFAHTFRHSFLCVIDGGQVITEQSSEDQFVTAEYEFSGHVAKLVSKGFNSTQNDKVPIEIAVDGADVSVNRRGLNIVVWDKKNNKMADSVCFDTFGGDAVFRKG